MISNISNIARDVESTATNLGAGEPLKIKIKKKKMIKKQNMKTENSMESATIAVRKGI